MKLDAWVFGARFCVHSDLMWIFCVELGSNGECWRHYLWNISKLKNLFKIDVKDSVFLSFKESIFQSSSIENSKLIMFWRDSSYSFELYMHTNAWFSLIVTDFVWNNDKFRNIIHNKCYSPFCVMLSLFGWNRIICLSCASWQPVFSSLSYSNQWCADGIFHRPRNLYWVF